MSFLLLTRAVLDFTRFVEAKLNKYKTEWPIVYFGDKLLILASFDAFLFFKASLLRYNMHVVKFSKQF